MLLTAFLHGIMLAFGLILPLGVQNVFVFTQGAIQGRMRHWLPVVLTAAICDTLLIGLAVGGVSVLVLSLTWFKTALIMVGVLFLTYMGWLTWKSSSNFSDNEEAYAGWSVKRQVVFALSVSILNPNAILDTIGVIGTSSLSYQGEAKLAFMVACISVSWLWFFSLAYGGQRLRKLDNADKIMKLLNKVSAVIMWVCAIYLLQIK